MSNTWTIIILTACAAGIAIWYILNAPDIREDSGVKLNQEERRKPENANLRDIRTKVQKQCQDDWTTEKS